MTKTISQKVIFQGTSPKTIYATFLNSKLHSLATGGTAKISEKVGAAYSAWDGYIKGKNLHLVKNKLIVQTWRSTDFKSSDEDSVITFALEAEGTNTVLTMTHCNVPNHQYMRVKGGWNEYYWKPWKKYLTSK